MRGAVMLTGCNGFLGRAVGEALFCRGWAVTGAVRREGCLRREDAAHLGRVAAVGDLHQTTDWNAALAGASCVIHTAAAASSKGLSCQALWAANVEGTAKLATEAAQHGVERFIFVSTVKVHGETSNGRPLREEDALTPAEPYAESKLAAERALRAIQSTTGMTVVIVRPTLLYGPGVRGSFFRLLQAAAHGVPLPFGSLHNRRSMMTVANAADLLATCVTANVDPLEILVAADPEPLSTPAWCRELAAAFHRQPRLIAVPPALMAGVARLAGCSTVYSKLCGSLEADAGKANRRLGWQPPQTRADALDVTAAWYLSRTEGGRALCAS